MNFAQFFYQYITEERGIQKAFHYAPIERVQNMILHNKIIMSYVGNDLGVGDDDSDISSQIPGKYNFYLSLSRIYLGGYNIENTGKSAEVIIEFNRSRLAHNYRIIPFNYYRSTDFYDPPKFRYTDENEDRVVSNRSIIPNALKYIDKLYLYFPLTNLGKLEIEHRYTKLMLKELADAGIDFEIYRNYQNFRNRKSPDIKNDIRWFDLEAEYGTHVMQQVMPKPYEPHEVHTVIAFSRILRGDTQHVQPEEFTDFLTLKNAEAFLYKVEQLRTVASEPLKRELQLLAKYLRTNKISIRQLFDQKKELMEVNHPD